MTITRLNPDYAATEIAYFTAGEKGTINPNGSKIWKRNGIVYLTLWVYGYSHVSGQEWIVANVPSGFRPPLRVMGALGCTNGSGYFVINVGGSVAVSGSITGGTVLVNASYPAA